MVHSKSSGPTVMNVLRTVLTKAFKVKRPVFAMVYNAYYNVCMAPHCGPQSGSHSCRQNIIGVIKAALVQGGKLNGLNESQFKTTAAMVGNAITFQNRLLEGYTQMVTEAWDTIKKHAATKIQKEWRFAQSCPERSLCYRRLMEEWLDLKKTLP